MLNRGGNRTLVSIAVPAASILLGIMGLMLGALRAESPNLENVRGVVLHRNAEKQVDRVIVRGRAVDAEMVSAMKEIDSLRDLELHGAQLGRDAWRELATLRQRKGAGREKVSGTNIFMGREKVSGTNIFMVNCLEMVPDTFSPPGPLGPGNPLR
jgi:hypothetical protein